MTNPPSSRPNHAHDQPSLRNSAGSPARRERRTRRTRAFRLEQLEARLQMAVATQVDHEFRSSDFSINGTWTYQFSSPANRDFLDQINNGTYSGSTGHVDWTSPTQATGFFSGSAVGTGHTSVIFAGSRRGCADYTIRDEGRLDFSIDAAVSDFVVTQADATSTVYTSYKDLTGGQCPAPNPPWSRFFGGTPTLYDGSFSSNTHAVAVTYVQTGDNPMTVTSPAATIQWADSAASDLALTGASYYPTPTAPLGWETLPQTATLKPITTVDPESGGVTLDASLLGKLLKTAAPGTPLVNLRLFWASSGTDTTGTEIPITSNSAPVGLYWNSATMSAQIEQLPAPPAGATHLRATLVGPTGSDANSANSSIFLPLGLFEVGTRTSGPITAGDSFDGSSSSLLTTTDLANPDIRVFAYNPISVGGGFVTVDDDLGGFTYDSAGAPGVEALAEGEVGQDVIEFLAIKNQRNLDAATHVITVIGVNDPPLAINDERATANDTKLSVTAASLMSNDSDPDHGDHVRIFDVTATSDRGATVRILRDGMTGAISGLEYDPTSSAELRGLAAGAQIIDQLTYSIRDDRGLESQATLSITVTGATAKLIVGGIPDQLVRAGDVVGPLIVALSDPDGDPSDLIVTAVAANGTLIPAANIQVTGSGANRSLSITTEVGLTGKTTITVSATDGGAKQASTSFALHVGSTSDLDLDGIADSVEDAAPHAGDMNQDGVPDSQQSYVVSVPALTGGAYVQWLTAQPNAFEATAMRDGSTDPAAPSGMQLPFGVTHVELVLASGTTAQAAIRSNLTGAPLNRLLQIKPAGTWSNAMRGQNQGAVLDSTGQMLVTLVDGGRLDSGPAADRRIVLDAGLANANAPWRNNDSPLDVTNDGAVAPIDALLIINELNGPGSHPLPSIPVGSMTIPDFLDTSGDNFVAPIDALLVINQLNALSTGEGEGEDSLAAVAGLIAIANLAADDTHDAPVVNSSNARAAALAAVLTELQPGSRAVATVSPNDASVPTPNAAGDESHSIPDADDSTDFASLEPFA